MYGGQPEFAPQSRPASYGGAMFVPPQSSPPQFHALPQEQGFGRPASDPYHRPPSAQFEPFIPQSGGSRPASAQFEPFIPQSGGSRPPSAQFDPYSQSAGRGNSVDGGIRYTSGGSAGLAPRSAIPSQHGGRPVPRPPSVDDVSGASIGSTSSYEPDEEAAEFFGGKGGSAASLRPTSGGVDMGAGNVRVARLSHVASEGRYKKAPGHPDSDEDDDEFGWSGPQGGGPFKNDKANLKLAAKDPAKDGLKLNDYIGKGIVAEVEKPRDKNRAEYFPSYAANHKSYFSKAPKPLQDLHLDVSGRAKGHYNALQSLNKTTTQRDALMDVFQTEANATDDILSSFGKESQVAVTKPFDQAKEWEGLWKTPEERAHDAGLSLTAGVLNGRIDPFRDGGSKFVTYRDESPYDLALLAKGKHASQKRNAASVAYPSMGGGASRPGTTGPGTTGPGTKPAPPSIKADEEDEEEEEDEDEEDGGIGGGRPPPRPPSSKASTVVSGTAVQPGSVPSRPPSAMNWDKPPADSEEAGKDQPRPGSIVSSPNGGAPMLVLPTGDEDPWSTPGNPTKGFSEQKSTIGPGPAGLGGSPPPSRPASTMSAQSAAGRPPSRPPTRPVSAQSRPPSRPPSTPPGSRPPSTPQSRPPSRPPSTMRS